MSTVHRGAARPSEAGSGRDVPGRSRWPVFGVVAISLLMISIDQTVVATALSAIEHDLDTSLAWGSWTITIYALGQIMAMPIAGRLSEQFGRKRVFVLAVGLFTLASLACGLSGGVETLVASRAVQGLAGGAVMPAAAGLVADVFGPNRDRAIGMFTSIFPIGAVIGPIVGGVLITYHGWRSIFLVNLPVGLLVVGLACWVVTERRDRTRTRVDLRGIGLLVGFFLAAMTAISLAGAGVPGAAWHLPVAGGVALLALVIGAAFVRHASRAVDPVVPIELLRGRDFGTINVINLLFGAAAVGFAALVPLYAQQRYGFAPLLAGILLVARALAMFLTSGMSVLLLRRFGTRNLMVVGFGLLVAGLLLLAAPPVGSPEVWLMIGAAVSGLGMGMAAPATNNAGFHLAPDRVPALSGLRGMFRQGGAILAISVTTSIMSVAADPGLVQAWILVVFAVLMLAAIPLIYRTADHRGRW